MTPAELAKEIKTGLRGSYIFAGEESYLKNFYLGQLKNEVFGIDAYSEVSGETRSVEEVVSEALDVATSPSFVSDKKLTVIYDLDLKSPNESGLSALEFLFDQVGKTSETVLILDTRPENFDRGTDKKPSKAMTRLSKAATPVIFAKETAARLSAWAMRHFANDRINASQSLCDSLVARVGRDMLALRGEIDKLTAFLLSEGRNVLTKEDIDKISVTNTEIQAFDFSNAILDGNTERAMLILSDSKLRKEAPELILGSVIKVYSELYTVKALSDAGMVKSAIAKETGIHEFKVGLYLARAGRLSRAALEKAVSLCHEADIKIKTSQTDKYAVLDELVVSLYFAGFVK